MMRQGGEPKDRITGVQQGPHHFPKAKPSNQENHRAVAVVGVGEMRNKDSSEYHQVALTGH